LKTFAIILTNLISLSTLGQSTKNDTCITNENSETKVNKLTYPFNNVGKILLVKYKFGTASDKQNLNKWDTTGTGRILPKKGKIVDTTEYSSKFQLTDKGMDSLIKIINLSSVDNAAFEAIFGEPANAILFIDNKGKIIEYIIIGFGQFGNSINYTQMTSSAKINLGYWCSIKGQMLVEFFQKRGVEPVILKSKPD